MTLVDRLLAGEKVFLPGIDHGDITSQSSDLYRAVRRAGKFLHMRQGNHGGDSGLVVWVDNVQRRKAIPEPKVTMIARPLE